MDLVDRTYDNFVVCRFDLNGCFNLWIETGTGHRHRRAPGTGAGGGTGAGKGSPAPGRAPVGGLRGQNRQRGRSSAVGAQIQNLDFSNRTLLDYFVNYPPETSS